ncbi:MAG: hypothetical protein OHK0028_03380 [Deltaproteobacteria bacterium]
MRGGNHDVRRKDGSPEIEGGNRGVLISGGGAATVEKGCVIRGTVRLKQEKGSPIEPATFHRALVLVVTSQGGYHVSTPFRDSIAFEDDFEVTDDSITGYFELDVVKHADIRSPGTYYVLFSHGVHLSNVLELTVTP